MIKKNLVVALSLIVNLLLWTSLSVRATPLSLDQNIKAVLARQAASGEGFDFVVTGDNRDGIAVYKRILDRARAFNPLFILNTGDLVSAGRSFEYENYRKQIARCDIPILHIPGNHDVRHGSENYRQYVGDLNWYFDLNGIRMIGLDNASGKFSADAVVLARKTLTRQKICLVTFHVPPAIGHWAARGFTDDERAGDGGEVMGLIKKAKAPMVFLGHFHLYDEIEVDNIKYVVSGGGGAPLRSKYGFGKAEYGFVLVSVRPGGITHRWVPLEPTLVDRLLVKTHLLVTGMMAWINSLYPHDPHK